MKRGLFTLLGFVLFILGMVSLFLTLVSVKISFLVWMDSGGLLLGFIGKIVMVLAGAVIIALASTDWKKERELLEKERERSGKGY